MPIIAPVNPFITATTTNIGYSLSATHLTLQPGPGGPATAINAAGLWVTGELAQEAIHAETKAGGAGAICGYSLAPTGSSSGVFGVSTAFDGVHGISQSKEHAGVSGINESGGTTAYGVWAKGTPAGHFEGNVEVTGDITLTGADCAEQFDCAEVSEIFPGMVVALDGEGALQLSCEPYDRKVAGVISGAGDLRPTIILDKRESERRRVSVALTGKVYCAVDAQYGAIEVGDLLTSSATPGCAMKAADPARAFGSVIGKALRPVRSGRDLIPILVTLQ